ncbi:uncharacterized protein LOC142539444 [Primulina tabacum]|uniref:uncharacterized protein LOC142539444 n=1 Tax=Primulina tabacum TaxID=48773 RepID=UPI003F5ACE5A
MKHNSGKLWRTNVYSNSFSALIHISMKYCGPILATKPLPGLCAAFSEVRYEESHRKLMLGSSRLPHSAASALATARPSFPSVSDSGTRHVPHAISTTSSHVRNGRLWCDKCKKPNHTVDTCWRIHGKQADWKPNRELPFIFSYCRRCFSSSQQPFTQQQLDALQRLFSQMSAQSTTPLSTGNAANQGNDIKKTIGSAGLCGGLFLFQMEPTFKTAPFIIPRPSFLISCYTFNSNKEIDILLWHYRLGYRSLSWGNLVTWRRKKQSVVAISSVEAEFRALSNGICEGMWLKTLLYESKIGNSHPIEMMCDNQAALNIVKNPVHHD